MFKNVFGFAEHQEKAATYGLEYQIFSTTNSNTAVMNKAPGIADAKIVFRSINWFVPHYTPALEQQDILSKQILGKKPREV